jgi:hypothetical protein
MSHAQEDEELRNTKVDWSTPYDEWLIPILNRFRYGGAIECRAIPSEIQLHIEEVIAAARNQTLAEVREQIKGAVPEKRVVEIAEPSLRQGAGGGSSPFFCDLCGMSEITIMDNKEDGKYFCHCSYWSDPHNAYLDRSGGKWLGWKDKQAAIDTLQGMPTEDNGFNDAIDTLTTNLKEKHLL